MEKMFTKKIEHIVKLQVLGNNLKTVNNILPCNFVLLRDGFHIGLVIGSRPVALA
jgi:hypothetical protein